MSNTRIRIAAATMLAAAGLSVTAALTTTTANAYTVSELAYLNSLSNIGRTVYDAPAAIGIGYSICAALNYEDGNAVARDLFVSRSYGEVPTLHSAAQWVNTAASTLCPWVWANGSVTGQY